MSVNPDIQEEFARQMQETYQESTLLPDICNVRQYRKRDKNIEFVQIGKRVAVPVDVFEQQILKPTTNPFARNITTGEENFFLTDLVNAADDETIPSKAMNSLSIDAIEDTVNEIEKADTVFIPYADEYTKTVNDWLKEGISLAGGTQIEVAGSILDIHQVVPKFGIKDVLVANSREIDLVQKQAKDTEPPKGLDIDESMTYINDGQDFMVYFAQDSEPGGPNDQYDEYLDVVFRVVVSQPIVHRKSAVRLEAPPGLELTDVDD